MIIKILLWVIAAVVALILLVLAVGASMVVMPATGTAWIRKNWYRRRRQVTLKTLGVIPT